MLDKKKLQAERELRDLMTEYNCMTLPAYKPSLYGITEQQARARRSFLLSAISVLKSGAGTLQDFQEERAVERAIENGLPVPDFSKRQLTPEQRGFAKFLMSGDGKEYRDAQSGTGAVANSAGSAGGYFVPQEFDADISLAQKQTDDLLNPDNVNIDSMPGLSGQPKTYSGWDLSSISSSRVNENTLQNPDSFPTASKLTLQAYMQRSTLGGSYEFDNDNYFGSTALLARAFGVAFARGIGAEVAANLVSGAVNSGITISDSVNSSPFDFDNFAKFFYSLNRVYRNSPKCAFAMNEATIEKLRLAKDSMQRPLINAADGVETLFGKKILSCPSIPGTLIDSGIAPGKVIVGDMSHLVVRLSQTEISLDFETRADKGEVLYTGRKRTDSAVFDPSGGTNSPIIYATISAA